jgi:hypothetical protein
LETTGKKDKHLSGSLVIPEHNVSYKEKAKNDFEWVEDMFETYDRTLHVSYDERMRLDFKINLSIGKMPKIDNSLKKSLSIIPNIESLKYNFNKIVHYPIINTVYNSLIGVKERLPFKLMAYDIGKDANNHYKEFYEKSLEDYLDAKYIVPIMQSLEEQFGDQAQDPRAQQQMQQQMDAMTPKDVASYLQGNYVSPHSVQAQRIADDLSITLDLKNISIESFKQEILSGEAKYFVGSLHGSPIMEVCDPKGLSWWGSSLIECIEDSDVVKYEVYRTPIDTISRYSEYLTKEDVEYLLSSTSMAGGQLYNDKVEGDIIGLVSAVPGILPNGIDIRTRDGQETLKALKATVSVHSKPGMVIRDCHVQVRSMDWMKRVTRMDEGGRLDYVWRDSHYKSNPENGDIEVKDVPVPVIYECRKLGVGGKSIYIQKGRLPFQQANPDNPYKPKMSYYGGRYYHLLGNATSCMSPFDFGIPYQLEYNVENARLKEEEGYNLGRVTAMLTGLKPDDVNYDQYVDMIRNNRFFPIDEEKLMSNTEYMNLFKSGHLFSSIDLSNRVAIGDHLAKLDRIYNQMLLAMSTSPSSMGQAGQYMTNQNNRENIDRTNLLTTDIFKSHSKFFTNAINGLMEVAKVCYAKRPKLLMNMVDNVGMSIFELDMNMLSFSQMGIKFVDSTEEFDKINTLKGLYTQLASTNNLDMVTASRVIDAGTSAEIINISLEERARREQQQQMALESQKEIEAMKLETMMKLKEFELGGNIQRDKMKYTTQINVAEMNSMALANQYDIDKDNENDLVQREREKSMTDARQAELDRMAAARQAELDRKFEFKQAEAERKLKIQLEKIRSKARIRTK